MAIYFDGQFDFYSKTGFEDPIQVSLRFLCRDEGNDIWDFSLTGRGTVINAFPSCVDNILRIFPWTKPTVIIRRSVIIT